MSKHMSLLLVVGLLAGATLMVGCTTYSTYTVKEGQTSFRDVAETVYGDPNQAGEIAEANPDVTGADIKPGAKLKVPHLKDPEGKTIEPKQCDREQVWR